jgi:hypothetical protein
MTPKTIRVVQDRTVYHYDNERVYITAERSTNPELVYVQAVDLIDSNKAWLLINIKGEWVTRAQLTRE